ncbi:hypothetical protein RB195_010970 [Necator americanus]|uniref:Secreted protein n=1 Tax=Necator americanus TaxID=51031 RepID=A0ABR1D099_NECAM
MAPLLSLYLFGKVTLIGGKQQSQGEGHIPTRSCLGSVLKRPLLSTLRGWLKVPQKSRKLKHLRAISPHDVREHRLRAVQTTLSTSDASTSCVCGDSCTS